MRPSLLTSPMRTAWRNSSARICASRFDRSRLPSPADYYAAELGALRGGGEWKTARCCFHPDTNPSLSVNISTGGFICHSCGVKGGGVLDFRICRYGDTFTEAARMLGAWRERT